jgi:hypothetical protein
MATLHLLLYMVNVLRLNYVHRIQGHALPSFASDMASSIAAGCEVPRLLIAARLFCLLSCVLHPAVLHH